MAINQNHLFEEIEGVKCAIVEKNASASRVEFLKGLLSFNGYDVRVVASPLPKTAVPSEEPEAPATYTVGVTDVMFNPVNAIFGRLLKTKDGRIVTLAYWQEKEVLSTEEIPYFEKQ
jgi:hypothetical protein